LVVGWRFRCGRSSCQRGSAAGGCGMCEGGRARGVCGSKVTLSART